MNAALSLRTFAWSFLLATMPLVLCAQEPGVVRGQVSNAATNAYLQNALVATSDGARSALTDQQGAFELALPAGEARLTITYPGLDPQTLSVVVVPGRTVVRDVELTAAIYKLDALTVSGVREGNAAAIAQQRQAPNVKNVVASDSFGNMADGNIGAFLQQLPGVVATYVGADVRTVMIRGISADLNSVTMDGTRLASAPSTTNTPNRAFEWEQASLGLIETIELTKSPTPDMDADSIGGNVNLVSKSAFDRANPKYVSWQIGGVWRPKYQLNSKEFVREPIRDIGPSLNLTYSDVWGGNRNIGVLFNATYHSQPGGDTAALMSYPTIPEPAYVFSVNAPRPAGAPRTRLALNAKIDYKLSNQTVLTFNTLSNWFHENNDTRIHALSTTNSAANFRPGYTSRYSEVLPNANSLSSVLTTNDDKFGRTYAFQPSVKHRFPGLLIDYGASFSNSFTQWEHATKKRHSWWHNPLGNYPKGQTMAVLRNVGFIVDRTQSPAWPKLTQTAGADIYDLNNYTGLNISNADRGQEDVVVSGSANLKKSLALPVPTYVKVGASYRRQERQIWNMTTNWDYTGPDGVFGTADDNVGVGQFLDRSGQYSDANQGYRQPPWINSYLANQHKALHPELWAPRITSAATGSLLDSTVTFLSNDRRGTETVMAGYCLGNVKLGPLSLLAGVRFEVTEDEGTGPVNVITADERVRRVAWVGPVTLAESNRRALAQYGTKVTQKGDNRRAFPGAHLKYQPLSRLVTRADYAASIGRPSLGNLIPLTTVNDTAGVVTLSNPALKPQYSNNFDVTAEYYFEPAGFVSGGLFLKEVKNFIFTRSTIIPTGANNGFDGLYGGYTQNQAANGGSARYRGFELSYTQQFTFLPGYWRGLGLSVNFTKTESAGNYGGATYVKRVGGIVPRTGNVIASYVYGRVDVRISTNWTGLYPVTVNVANPWAETWQRQKVQVNLRTKYYLAGRKLNLFCDIENLNRSPITEQYLGSPDRPSQTRIVASKYVAGLQGRF